MRTFSSRSSKLGGGDCKALPSSSVEGRASSAKFKLKHHPEDVMLVCNIIATIVFVKGHCFPGPFAMNFDEDERREVIAIHDGVG